MAVMLIISSALHRSSTGTRRIVLHFTASPFGLTTICSPVRAICPTPIASIDLGASLFFWIFFLPRSIFRGASLAMTISPISASGRVHFLPVSLSMGVMPSCPTEKWVRQKAACVIIHSMIGWSSAIGVSILASRANFRALTCPLTSCTAFSQAPLLAGL